MARREGNRLILMMLQKDTSKETTNPNYGRTPSYDVPQYPDKKETLEKPATIVSVEKLVHKG